MEKTNGSRLLQMKARFQQKQMQEREMKIASLYEAQQARALGRVRLSPSNGVSEATTPPEPPIPRQPGKVRQMFEERRTKAGIDKSYPLQPIHNTERTAARKVLPNGYSKVTSNSRTSVEKKTSKTSVSSTIVSVKKTKKTDLINGSGDLNHNHEPDMNSSKHELSQSNGNFVLDTEELDRVDNNYLIENETFPDSLAPATPRSPVPELEPKKPPRKSPVVKSSSPAKPKLQPAPVAPPRRVISEKSVSESNKSRAGVMQRAANPVPKKNTVTAPSTPRKATASVGGSSSKTAVGGEGDACAVCGRRFAPDRIEKHQSICRKTQAKKRKPFDVLKHRLAGTEAEPFISKLRKSGPGAASATKANKPLNSNWRQKHNEFIQAIRAAKQVQAHLNAGGKLSDLPPPPPSENPDYVQCPHCNRRFNQGAAERHIPKCANFQFNKPKPNAKRR